MFTYTFPKRDTYELERNYFWEKYFSKSLMHRNNWRYVDYTQPFEEIDLIYSSNLKLNVKGSINGNIYHIVETISDKITINRKLKSIKSRFIPEMYFDNLMDRPKVSELLKSSSSFFYLKGDSGSVSRTTFIIQDYSEIPRHIKENSTVKNWFLSENIESFLYKRKGRYQPNGFNYNERYGHKGRLKFFILFKIDNRSKSVYMYDQSVYEIAPDEFTGDYTSRSQNIIIGMGSEELHYPENYDPDPDYGFKPVDIFGEDYFRKIVPQLGGITRDIFRVVAGDLYCKNDKYYNKKFKSCFHFGTVDVIVTPELKCKFLEINTKPVMDRPSYETIINYPMMIDSIVEICIDPYFPPEIESYHPKGWHKISTTPRRGKKTFYVSPSWKFSQQVKDFYKTRYTWEQIVYPNLLLPGYKIDFVGKRKIKNDNITDQVFTKGHLISKILTLDYYLGNKKNMYTILSRDPRSSKFLPETLTINIESDYKTAIKNINFKKGWILKPSNGLRGQDIFISRSYNEIVNFIETHQNYTEWVLSEYIDKPFLLKLHGNFKSGASFNDTIGRKTHIRIYVLIKKINNRLTVYLYDQPLIFCAVKEYNNDITDEYSQLTNLYLASKYYNHNLNIDGSLAYQDLSFPLISFLNRLYGPKFYKKKVLPQIKTMLKVILKSSRDYLYCTNRVIPGRRNCFQNIAIDIMPDENWKLFLLEINGRPGMNAPGYNWGGLTLFTRSMMERLYNIKNAKNQFIKI